MDNIINKENQNKKNQNKNWIFEGRILWGIILILVAIIILLFSFIWYSVFVISAVGFAIIVLIGLFYEFVTIFRQTNSNRNRKRFLATIGIIFYSGVSLYSFSHLMIFDDKANFLYVLILAPAGIADALAFIVGKLKGKRKMIKRLSPSKTWLGTIAGYSVSFIVTLIILLFLFSSLKVWQILTISALIPVLAISGDLIGSGWKRIMGVKDSGNAFKGHGGVLDRAASILLPIYFVFLLFWFL